MQENYWISIVGRQKIDGETGEVEVNTLGSYVRKGKNRYIVYKEYDADTAHASRTSVLKVEEGEKMTLMRGNGDSTRLILENGKRHFCSYDTGFGCMTVGVFTQSFRSSLTDQGGSLDVSYTLDVDSSLSSFNDLHITIKEASAGTVPEAVLCGRKAAGRSASQSGCGIE